jgi:hypothetical protein
MTALHKNGKNAPMSGGWNSWRVKPDDSRDQWLQVKAGCRLCRDFDANGLEGIADHRANGCDARSLPAHREFVFESPFTPNLKQPPDLRRTGDGDHIDLARRHLGDRIGAEAVSLSEA